MAYAFVQDDVATPGSLPKSARKLSTGEWVMGLATAPVELVEACGWYVITPVAAPAYNAATHKLEQTVTVQTGRPVQTWSVVVLNAAELLEVARNATAATLETQARNAIESNSTYLAIGAPSNAQVVAQVRALTQQNSAIIRRVLALLGDRTVLD